MKGVPKNIKRGDPVIVHWLDIHHDGTDDPANAELAPCRTRGFFVCEKTSHGIESLVTSSTDHPGAEFMGWDIFPLSVVTKLERA
jgi:hypothetical protein